jgi:hypothetical protein
MWLVALLGLVAAAPVDVSNARIVVAEPDRPLAAKTAEFLRDEVEKRSGLRMEIVRECGDGAAIVLGRVGAPGLPAAPQPPARAEAYALSCGSENAKTRVYGVGHDDRGVLYAAGRMLRAFRFEAGRVTVDPELKIASAPQYPIRGHQFSYSSTNNTLDAWDLPQFEQYLRDNIIFGMNAIEITPPVKADTPPSGRMKRSRWDVNADLARLAGEYGLDVWLFIGATDGDYANSADAEAALERRRAVFQHISPVHAVFVPGGDPGDHPPQVLLPWLERMASILHEYHPNAEVWVSNQGFEADENDWFFDYLRRVQPKWLTGVVYGPWTKIALAEERERTPKQYRIRHYADIGHCVRCQYPVPQWDRAFALTLGREPINPRPRGTATIHNRLAPYTDGFVTYSEGVNDDVNKFVWNALGWDASQSVDDILEEYARVFMGEKWSAYLSQGLFDLEENWRGPLAQNSGVEQTLNRWTVAESKGPAELRSNWRFQEGLFRACYDAHLKRRLLRETEQEAQALGALRNPSPDAAGSVAAARRALAPLEVDADLCAKIKALGKALNDGIGLQMSVENYGAAGPERGAVLDFLDAPLNDRAWIEAQCAAALQQPTEEQKRAALARVASWNDPGPGGYYDDLGNASNEPHLVRMSTFEEDPAAVHSAQDEYTMKSPGRLSWQDQAQTLFGTPLRMRYEGLDPDAPYRVRVTYAGRFKASMRLLADGAYQVHGAVAQPDPVAPVEYDVPREATRDGMLELSWELVEGRGCQVAEIWLERKGE